MRGRTAARPLSEIAVAAARVFLAKGYREGGISDVATELGLSHGALYTYVRSKEALLYIALFYGADPEAVDQLTLPVPTPTEQDFEKLIARWGIGNGTMPSLNPIDAAGRSAADVLAWVIDEMYAFIEDNRALLSLVERCAQDLPELAQVYFVQGRRVTLQRLGDFLRHGIETGELRAVPDVPTAARFIVETIAWFAWHRLGDLDSAMLSDDDCRATTRHLLLAAFVPEHERG